MFFSRKKHSFKGNKNVLKRFYVRYSGFLPLIAAFSLGVFGTNIYYKNKQTVVTNQQDVFSTKVEVVTDQLNNEKDITDSLSSKNLELKQQLKEALSKAGSNDEDRKLTALTSELRQEKQDNQKLNDENARLKVRINSMLATVEATKNISKTDITEVGFKATVGSRNTVQDGNAKIVNNENFSKVRMGSTEKNLIGDKAESLKNNRNSGKKATKTDSKELQKVEKNSKKRTMKLKKGESLWNLSKRAYGKGVYYKKIIKANPSITEKNFKRLRPGATINVPR